MVTHLNVALDDDVAERVRGVKENAGLTWAEFLEEAASEVEASGPTNVVPTLAEESTERVETGRVSVEPAVGDLDLPGSGETLEARRIAVQTLYEYLQDHGTARRRDFLELVDPDAVGYSSAGSFWSNCIKGRDSLRALPGVDPPGEGEHTWRHES